ncbi:MAG TPA: hypothetical protein VGL78_15030, partial [Solirubrobacteraceae bacterium]
ETGWALTENLKTAGGKSDLVDQPRGLGARAQSGREGRAVAVVGSSLESAHLDVFRTARLATPSGAAAAFADAGPARAGRSPAAALAEIRAGCA